MIQAYELSVAIFVRGLTSLKVILTKAEAHASAHGIEPAALLSTRLAGDMHDLAIQVHWAGEAPRLTVLRLLGMVAVPVTAEARTFAGLHARLDDVVAHLRSVDAAALEAGLERSVEIPDRAGSKSMRGDRFLTEFAIPSFYFHLTTAYAILRHQGVALQKGDFLGS
jgi:hypothetical protein